MFTCSFEGITLWKLSQWLLELWKHEEFTCSVHPEKCCKNYDSLLGPKKCILLPLRPQGMAWWWTFATISLNLEDGHTEELLTSPLSGAAINYFHIVYKPPRLLVAHTNGHHCIPKPHLLLILAYILQNTTLKKSRLHERKGTVIQRHSVSMCRSWRPP